MNYKSYELIELKNKNGDNKITMKQKMCNYAIITYINPQGVLCDPKHLKHFDMTFIKTLSW